MIINTKVKFDKDRNELEYIMDNFDRSQWKDKLNEFTYEVHNESGTIYFEGEDKNFLDFYAVLPDQLAEGYQFPYNSGDIFEDNRTHRLWMMLDLPVLDSRVNINFDEARWCLMEYGNRSNSFDVTDGEIYTNNFPKDNKELEEKWLNGYQQIYVTSDKYTKVSDDDPRISNKIKEYQNIVRTEGMYALGKAINYTLFPF